MGLDITVHPKAVRLEEHAHGPHSDECYEAGHVQAYGYAVFTQSMRGLEPLESRGHSDLVFGPWFDTSGAESWGFRAGSYSGYGRFRDNLRVLAWDGEALDWDNLDAFRDRPFFELICFADNEGTIGPLAAADLAQDFAEHRARIQPQLTEWFRSSYDDWAKAFADTAGGGLVEFH